MKILDSDHCVAILRKRLDLRDWASSTESLAVTAVNVGELMHGVYKSNRRHENLARLSVLLAALVILPYDETAARQFGRVKTELELCGATIGDLDIQIASIALARGIPLVTHNQRHFERIPGLILEDWLEQGENE
jgi:tRNA(fMet)-specific endonuclease VapC